MYSIQKIERRIEELREELLNEISKSDNLISEDVVRASHKLDEALNEYNKIIKGK